MVKKTGTKTLCEVECAGFDVSCTHDIDTVAICVCALKSKGVPESEITAVMEAK